MTTELEFMDGLPLAYETYSGAHVFAIWHRHDIASWLEICDALGRRLASPIMGEIEIRRFWREVTYANAGHTEEGY